MVAHGFREYLKTQRPEVYKDHQAAINYLIDRHEDRFQNWQRFVVLRRGVKAIEAKNEVHLDGFDPSKVMLFTLIKE